MPINIREGYEVRPGQAFDTRFPTVGMNAPAPVSVGQQLGDAAGQGAHHGLAADHRDQG